MTQPNEKPLVIVVDEANTILNTSRGRALMDELLRTSRITGGEPRLTEMTKPLFSPQVPTIEDFPA